MTNRMYLAGVAYHIHVLSLKGNGSMEKFGAGYLDLSLLAMPLQILTFACLPVIAILFNVLWQLVCTSTNRRVLQVTGFAGRPA
jgi:hypothetical protein